MTPELAVPLAGALAALLGVVTTGLGLIIRQYGRFVDDQRARNRVLDRQNDKLLRQVGRLVDGLRTTRRELRATREENTTLKGEIRTLNDAVASSHREVQDLQREVEQLRRDRAGDRELLQQRDAEILRLRERLLRRTHCARRLVAVARVERGMMHTLQDELDALKPKYDAAVTRGNEKSAALENERRSNATLRERLDGKQAEIDNWVALVAALRAQYPQP
jgi:chromosome segregation ATPase